jgi:hypothetical protein
MAHMAKWESDSQALGCQLSVASSQQGGQAGAGLAMLLTKDIPDPGGRDSIPEE